MSNLADTNNKQELLDLLQSFVDLGKAKINEYPSLHNDIVATQWALDYIKDLEQRKEKLEQMLTKNNERDRESVQRFEEMRRDIKDSFYKRSYQTSIHKLNAKREVRKSILDFLKESK